MKNFVDHSENIDVIEALRSLHIRIETALEAGLNSAEDTEIFTHSLKTSSILLTFDKDFGNIIRFKIRESHGIVIVYVEGMSREEILRRTINFFQHTTAE
ncbi:MAG: DUF5615 family PIN-like protein, partial [Nitrospinae bacterium]|nr:DUF5615 family PIN-like protein [Nitrospinota bacterium]